MPTTSAIPPTTSTTTLPGGCGNGVCDGDETASDCSDDCGFCGDFECTVGFETRNNCPEDCRYCGDGECGPGEDSDNCREDCPCDDPCFCDLECGWCGDHWCSPLENHEICPDDCGEGG